MFVESGIVATRTSVVMDVNILGKTVAATLARTHNVILQA